MNDKPIRLMWSHRDPNTRKNNAANIFIKARQLLAPHAAAPRPRAARAAPSRAAARAAPDAARSRRACALEAARIARIARRATAAASPGSRAARRAQNLDESIDTKALHDTFEAFGKIVSAKVTVGVDGKSRGFGFIQFDTPEAAATAIEKVNGMQIEGRKVFVGPFQKKAERGGDGQAKCARMRHRAVAGAFATRACAATRHRTPPAPPLTRRVHPRAASGSPTSS
jgi:hypothetical protein